MAATTLLGFSSGIPLALTGATLQAWMTTEKVDLTVIGIFSLVGLPYGIKFIWSPIMDLYVPPFLGRRRGWLLICQVALMLGILAMAFSHPAANPGITAALAFMVAFFSASQDIVVDAYRTDVLTKDELGPGAGLYVMGYRIAMLVSGALALILSDYMSWKMVYFLMAATLLVGIAASLFGPEPKDTTPPKSLSHAVVDPFVDFFKRKGAFEILLFMLIYKLDIIMASAMTTPFLLDLGFTRTVIGSVNKGFGFFATIIGTISGGAMMVKLGMKRSLWFFGIVQGVANLSFMLLAHLGHSYPMLITAVAIENICSGLGTIAYSAFMMSICNKKYSASQYALLTSLMAMGRVWGSAPSGYLAKNMGWEMYFLLCTLIAIPGLLLLTRFKKWSTETRG